MTGEKGYDASEIECDRDPDVLAEDVRNHLMRVFDEKREAVGDPCSGRLCAQIALRTMDTHWVAHLTDMEGLKAGIEPATRSSSTRRRPTGRSRGWWAPSTRTACAPSCACPRGRGRRPRRLSGEDDPFRPESMVYSDSRSDPVPRRSRRPTPQGKSARVVASAQLRSP